MTALTCLLTGAEFARETEGVPGALFKTFRSEEEAWDFIKTVHGGKTTREKRDLQHLHEETEST